MSPFYIAFEEYFGGYNFGTDNAWLDFKNISSILVVKVHGF